MHREGNRRHRRQRIRSEPAALRQHWPELFNGPVPLETGLTHQIRAARLEMPLVQFNYAMRFWMQSTAYPPTVAAGVRRHDPDGSPTGVPAEDQQVFAQEALPKRGEWLVEGVQGSAEPPTSAG